ncbi:MAG TPA: hypothetical protein VF549_06845 [Solirubrobacteraceae bacterium]
MSRRLALLLAAVATALCAFAAPALADPEEPNERITDPKTALEPGKEYTGAVENLGDDDYYRVLGSGSVTVTATVVSDACPDDTPALHVELRSYDSAFGSSSKDLQTNETGEVTLTLESGKEYRLLFNTFSGRDINACPNTRVDYRFTLRGGQAAPPEQSDPAPADTAPKRIMSKPRLRGYACLHQSQGATGFGDPAFRFTLKARGRWVDRTFARPVTARWKFRKGITTLYSKKGRRLYRFAQFEDEKGRYLFERPGGNDLLICR